MTRVCSSTLLTEAESAESEPESAIPVLKNKCVNVVIENRCCEFYHAE